MMMVIVTVMIMLVKMKNATHLLVRLNLTQSKLFVSDFSITVFVVRGSECVRCSIIYVPLFFLSVFSAFSSYYYQREKSKNRSAKPGPQG